MRRQSEGFSLIEVIIAIAILAVVAMSLLSYFSGANRYGNWGKTTQRADMAAQSVVEELASCTTFDQIENQLVAATGSAWTVVSTPTATKNEYMLSRKISVDQTDYAARVRLDFDSYKSAPAAVATTTPLSKFNDYQAPELQKVYSDHNVVLEETDQTEAAVGDLFYQIYRDDKSVTKTEIRNAMERTLHIDVANCPVDPNELADSAEKDLYLIKGRYEYQCHRGSKTYHCEMPVKEVKIEKKMLKKIYMFYRPVNGILNTETLDITADAGMPAGFQLSDFSYYAILQKDAVTPPNGYRLEITSAGNPASVELKNKVYNNANKLGDGSDGLITHKPKDRIAMITVEIYDVDETNFSEQNRIVMLQTSKGE